VGVVVTTQVNGEPVRREVEPGMTAAEFLRDVLRLTGTKVSCEQQICGACTILVDRRPTSACSTLVGDLDGRDVLTVEGLSDGATLHPVQQAFVEERGFQCGFCTPGMIMTTVALLDGCPNPTRSDVDEFFEGNLCRCTGYASIRRAVARAAARNADAGPAERTRGDR
jgi:aerobic-type carbon monoxide dehydrogenase small subunit (CoxS/CutS family)